MDVGNGGTGGGPRHPITSPSKSNNCEVKKQILTCHGADARTGAAFNMKKVTDSFCASKAEITATDELYESCVCLEFNFYE